VTSSGATTSDEIGVFVSCFLWRDAKERLGVKLGDEFDFEAALAVLIIVSNSKRKRILVWSERARSRRVFL
jgi:hypothetical protein